MLRQISEIVTDLIKEEVAGMVDRFDHIQFTVTVRIYPAADRRLHLFKLAVTVNDRISLNRTFRQSGDR